VRLASGGDSRNRIRRTREHPIVRAFISAHCSLLQCLDTPLACRFAATWASSSEARFDVAFAPIYAVKGILAEKHGENRREGCRERRTMAHFGGPKAPFSRASGRLGSIATVVSGRRWVHRARRLARQIGSGAPVFEGRGRETTSVRRGDGRLCRLCCLLSRVPRLGNSSQRPRWRVGLVTIAPILSRPRRRFLVLCHSARTQPQVETQGPGGGV
jgi:hypothetical protein